MPKFVNPGSQEAFRERMSLLAEWRLDVLAELVWLAMPFVNMMTWDEVSSLAIERFERSHYEENDPMFAEHGYSANFVNKDAILRRSSEIVDKLAETNRFVYSVPFEGVRKAHNRQEIEESMNRAATWINGGIEHYNHRAEYANQRSKTEVPLMRLALLNAGD